MTTADDFRLAFPIDEYRQQPSSYIRIGTVIARIAALVRVLNQFNVMLLTSGVLRDHARITLQLRPNGVIPLWQSFVAL